MLQTAEEDSPLARRSTLEVQQINGRQLTKRERQIVQQVLAGKTNREIASALRTSEHTVKVQLGKLYAKVGVKSRLELALKALRH